MMSHLVVLTSLILRLTSCVRIFDGLRVGSSLSMPLLREHLRASTTTPVHSRRYGNPEAGRLCTSLGLLAEDGAQEFLLGGEFWVSPFGVTLPTRMSPAPTFEPMQTMPSFIEVACKASSLTFGMSRVTSSLPELGVARFQLENSWMWMEVKTSSFTSSLAQMMIASSKL